jgi:hypothetical protein
MFNIFVGLSKPPDEQVVFLGFMVVGTVTGLIATIVGIGCIAGSHIAAGAFGFEFETDLDTQTVKTLIGAGLVLSTLFRVSIMMIPVGTGLSDVLFAPGMFTMGADPLANMLFFFAIVFILITVISGLMMAVS